jgi:hypothetical protein
MPRKTENVFLLSTSYEYIVDDTWATGTGVAFGWFGAGNTPSVSSDVERIDFSNDLTKSLTRGSLTLSREDFDGTSNNNFGWFIAGNQPGTTSIIDRITFSSDLSTASPRGNYGSTKYSHRSIGNLNYGWGTAGLPAFPTMSSETYRIDYSNDLSSASLKGPLTSTRRNHSAAGNLNYGWFIAGGTASGGTLITSVDRIDYSNDSPTASPRGNINSTVWTHASGGNNSYAWIYGGYLGSYITNIDRIDYSSDLSTSSSRGKLLLEWGTGNTFSNSNFGWIFGGSPNTTSMRLNFTNDTTNSEIRGSLNRTRNYMGSTNHSSLT